MVAISATTCLWSFSSIRIWAHSIHFAHCVVIHVIRTLGPKSLVVAAYLGRVKQIRVSVCADLGLRTARDSKLITKHDLDPLHLNPLTMHSQVHGDVQQIST